MKLLVVFDITIITINISCTVSDLQTGTDNNNLISIKGVKGWNSRSCDVCWGVGFTIIIIIASVAAGMLE